MVGAGMLVGTQIVRRLAASLSNDALVLSGLAGIGGAVLLLGSVPHIAATTASTFLIGFAFAAIIVPAQTLIQRETPPDMLGRVGSTNASIVFLGQILGLAVSGVLAEAIGVRLVFFLCAALALVLVGAGRLFAAPSREERGAPSPAAS
jgi:predicted MFS family arabinose efflux permease